LPFIIEPIDSIPERTGSGRAPTGTCWEILAALKNGPTGKAAVRADTVDELARLYKSAIQWIKRHPGEAMRVRKAGDTLYFWLQGVA
jgi:hypothetical protein